MGLFSYNYTKPGPGVAKDAPRKKGIFLLFEILGRKVFKIFQAMWLTVACSIPYLILMFLFITGVYGSYFTNAINSLISTGILSSLDRSTLMIMLCGFTTLVIFTLWGAGPASAGFAYISRSFTREEHVWIFSDFFGKFKENFKQSMILVVIDFAALFFIPNAIILYWNFYLTQNKFIWLILMYVCIMAFIVYTFMHFHIYQIMITFECKFKDLMKNAMTLAFRKSPINLILTILSIAILMPLFNFIHPLLAILLSLVVLFGFIRFATEFYSARVIEKIIKQSSEEN